ncbi:hypothetical protein CANCADRAFT_69724 [Tortispora caseinolytica NRRL Y-17796]|uniref:SEC7 domain-containing protein n=1 Tax=Tortispora caseinolytica NRRL Y-17796 TaxID=767744 RepID=A0A1E4TAK2_9ASCO|nr:hypothetical protein CANCADRAFT_69724 [Tortispora caseinolytica NRRL Y-17796]
MAYFADEEQYDYLDVLDDYNYTDKEGDHVAAGLAAIDIDPEYSDERDSAEYYSARNSNDSILSFNPDSLGHSSGATSTAIESVPEEHKAGFLTSRLINEHLFEEVWYHSAKLALTLYYNPSIFEDHKTTIAWLGSDAPYRSDVRRLYMALFDFRMTNVLTALRLLCNKVHLKGDSDSIYRLLTSFAEKWVNDNPQSGYQDCSHITALAYALLLANTDIHSARIPTKMKPTQFVTSVMDTLSELAPNDQTNVYSAFFKEVSIINRVDHESDSIQFYANDSKASKEETLRHFFAELQKRQLDLSHVQSSLPKHETGKGPKLVGFSRALTLSNDSLRAAYEQAKEEPEVELLGPPFAKEGILQVNLCIFSKKKNKKKDWQELFVVVQQGRISGYIVGGAKKTHKSHKSNKSIQSQVSLSWLENSETVFDYSLINARARVIDHPEGKNTWSLWLDECEVLFRAGTIQNADEFVNTCMYWTARISSPAVVISVTNCDYGWSRNSSRNKLSKWQAGALPSIECYGTEKEKMSVWKKAVSELNLEIAKHESIEELARYNNTTCQPVGYAYTNWVDKCNDLKEKRKWYREYRSVLSMARRYRHAIS